MWCVVLRVLCFAAFMHTRWALSGVQLVHSARLAVRCAVHVALYALSSGFTRWARIMSMMEREGTAAGAIKHCLPVTCTYINYHHSCQ